ncbi:GNAT family N-acetyltransferase [Nocardia vaccinii]|uniref:GNAT family N-acetyltransferase n=1 Tax=Nocardia vaccinii TaxID=1822 RepID=UPI000B2AE26C|nr:GNAT family N-acetyltransferase [Nocardia vaccinii]
MTVRQIPPQEWQTIRTARLAALAGSPPGTFATLLAEAQGWDEEHWRLWAARRTMFVAESGPDVIGCAGGILEHDVPVLVSMFVEPAARGSGVSRQLIDAVAGWARADGHAELRLWVVDGNTPAEKLYRRMGFTPTGVIRNTGVHAPDTEYEMSLPLR